MAGTDETIALLEDRLTRLEAMVPTARPASQFKRSSATLSAYDARATEFRSTSEQRATVLPPPIHRRAGPTATTLEER